MIRSLARYVRLNARLYLKGEAPVVVYSKERTGSVALYKSLVAAGVPAIATHYLDPAKIAEGKLSGSAQWASKHIVQPRRRAKFITLVRNPIDNLLSTFARNEFVDKPRARGLSTETALDVSPQEIVDRFHLQYLDGGEYRRELDWFESENRHLKRRAVISQHHWDAIADSKVTRHFIDERELADNRAKVQVGDWSSSSLAYLAK